MKKLLITITLVSTLCLVAQGQGAVNFANLVPGVFNAPFLFNDGVTKVPAVGYQASLLVGTSAGSLSLVDTVPLVVPGYIASKTETLAGIAAGTPIFFAIEVWSTAFTSYDAAFQSGIPNTAGESISPTASVIPTAAPNPPASLTGMGPLVWNPTPEPSPFVLACLGAATLLIFRKKEFSH